ncbi:MAG: TlpA disulfide reductase family protein [Niabella sp.]
MKNRVILFVLAAIVSLAGCKSSDNDFHVSGKIINAAGKWVYLEEVPVGTMRAMVVDSISLGKDGSFSLKATPVEAAVFNVRLDDNMYPVASVINDAPSIKLEVTMNKQNNQYPEKYDVQGSPASKAMQTFITGFNEKMQQWMNKVREADSLQTAKAPDSIINIRTKEVETLSQELKASTLDAVNKSDNPALSMFLVGYYQSTANGMGGGLAPLPDDQVLAMIADIAKKYPDHVSLAGLNQNLQNQAAAQAAKSWVGKQAPDFTLPDVNGTPVSLNSFKGKYVLVDFWASWCKPCRMENPTVVAAYNKFKDKNFTVLGVSLDEKKDAWLEAVKKDKLNWTQVSDLKFWNSIVTGLYKFEGIPFNVLLDPQGKVIAEGLRGPALEAKLAEVLK